ncbi:hypothetical protein F5Y10DRAFT_246826 [Nemania abortiva]|nr:hypothetical protein F5Y10DRAFT_246826 [Nemania abortiva]
MYSLSTFGCYLAACLIHSATSAETPLQSDESGTLHVAIVGAGLAGASTAFHLRRILASGVGEYQIAKITVYESSTAVGGQVKTIFPPESDHAIQAGATHFFEDNWCLSDAARSLDLELEAVRFSDGTMIWNGFQLQEDEFCFKPKPKLVRGVWDRIPSIRELARDIITRTLMVIGFESKHADMPLMRLWHEITTIQNKLSLFGKSSVFESVRDELDKLGLGSTISTSAGQFLDAHGVPDSLQTGMVQPCVEALFGVDLEQAVGLHVVTSMGSTRPAPVAIRAGNAMLITRMLNESMAGLHVDSQVIRVETGNRRQFALTISSAKTAKQTREEHDVIIFTGDSMARLRPRNLESPSAAFQHYVTHFSTEQGLHPRALSSELSWLPLSVLTTANSSSLDHETRVVRLTTIPDFYIDRRGCSFDDDCDQFVYGHRVDSRLPMSKKSSVVWPTMTSMAYTQVLLCGPTHNLGIAGSRLVILIIMLSLPKRSSLSPISSTQMLVESTRWR